MSGAFFAEISAKVCHHNIHVAREGCTMLVRLLATDVSALLLLHEGKLLALLQDVLSGVLLGGGGPRGAHGSHGIPQDPSFGLGMRPGADGTAAAAALHVAAPSLTPSVWQEAELVLQILDVLLLFSEKLLSFVGPQSSTQHRAIAAVVDSQQAEASRQRAATLGGLGIGQSSSSSSHDNYLRHLDNSDMFFMSFAALLSAVIALPPRRGVVAMTQGRFRHAFSLVVGWCDDISPHFVNCVLTAFGAESAKGRSEAALRILMLTNGFVSPAQVSESFQKQQKQLHQQQPILTANGTIYHGGDVSGGGFNGGVASVASITDAATTALNRLGPQKALLTHKIEGFFLSPHSGPPSGFSPDSAVDASYYAACRRVWRRRTARMRALIAPFVAAATAPIGGPYLAPYAAAANGKEGVADADGDDEFDADEVSANAFGRPQTGDDASLEEPEGISVISGNVSVLASSSAGGYYSSTPQHYAQPLGTSASALNKTPMPTHAAASASATAADASSSGAPTPVTPSAPSSSPPPKKGAYPLAAVQAEVEAIRRQVEAAQSHESFCDGLSRLWGAVASAIASGVNPEVVFAFVASAPTPSAASQQQQQQQSSPVGAASILRTHSSPFIPIGGPTGFTKFFADCLKRVFSVLPANQTDAVVFHWSLRLLGLLLQHSSSTTLGDHMDSAAAKQGTNPHNRSMRAVILTGCCPFLVAALSAASGASLAAANAAVAQERADLMQHYPHYDPAATAAPPLLPPQRRNAPTKLSLVSTEMEILSFLRIAEECSTSSQLEPWVRSGLFSALVNYIEPFGAATSLLVDAPTLHDGSLSEDVYLTSALAACRSEAGALAAASMKLLCAVATNHAAMLCEVFPAEALSCAAIAVPLLARVAVNNPTVEAAPDTSIQNSSGNAHGGASSSSSSPAAAAAADEDDGDYSAAACKSLVYRLPRSQRSSRHTPVGECAVLALDALLCLPVSLSPSSASVNSTAGGANGGAHVASSLVPFLPSLARATVRSVFPHLRGTLFRILTRTTNSAAELLSLVRTMPSAVASAVAVVLSYDGARVREWEVSAAAEWLSQVLRLTATSDASVTASFNFLQTALPLRLLQMSTLNGPSYVSGTMLSLLLAVARQQQLLTTAGGCGQLGLHSALAPQSARSLPHWRTLMQSSTAALRRLHEKWGADGEANANSNSATAAAGASPSSKVTIATNNSHQQKSAAAPLSPAATPLSYSSADAPHRYIAAMEAATSHLLFANGVVRGLGLLFFHHTDLKEHFGQEEVLAVLEAALLCPQPETVATAMAAYYRTELLYSKPLSRAFEQLQSSVCELFAIGWYGGGKGGAAPHRGAQHLPLSVPAVLVPIARRLSDRSLSAQCRQSFAALLSAVVEGCVPQHTQLTEALSTVADALFLATTCLPPTPTAIAAQCRLVASFGLANAAAFECGWVNAAIRSAYQIVVGRVAVTSSSSSSPNGAGAVERNTLAVAGPLHPQVGGSGLSASAAAAPLPPLRLDAARAHQLAELLSIVSSGYSYPHCLLNTSSSSSSSPSSSAAPPSREAEGGELLAKLLLRLLGAADAPLRALALGSCRALASSAAGRAVLCLEASRACPAESSERSCFTKLTYNTLGAVMNDKHFGVGQQSSSPASPFASAVGGSTPRRGAGGSSRNTTPLRRRGSIGGGSPSPSSSSAANNNHLLTAPSGSATSRLPHHLTAEFHAGVDIVSVILAKSGGGGGSSHPGEAATASSSSTSAEAQHFASAVVKQRCIENVETYMLQLARGRQAIPIAFYRFLAAASFSVEVQPILCRRPELVTLVYEMASMTASGLVGAESSSSFSSSTAAAAASLGLQSQQTHCEKSSLALLVLRNMCFYAPAKIQLCQDTRIMLLLKSCLSCDAASASVVAGGSAVSPHYSSSASSPLPLGRSVTAAGGGGVSSGAGPAALPVLELCRRQQLAASALAALAHGSQRAKSYVRGLLAQAPAVDIALLAPAEPMAGEHSGCEGAGAEAEGGDSNEGAANPYRAAAAQQRHVSFSRSGGASSAGGKAPLPPMAFDYFQRNTAESAALLQALAV